MNMEPKLHGTNTDDLGKIVFALLTELWVMRDRLAVMEKLLTERGGLHPGEIEDYVPDSEFSAELEAQRDRMVAEVVGSTLITEEMGVDDLLARVGLDRPESVKPEPA
ncbi:hypothetical protein HFP57_16155 [Parasphingopyxis algicola]|uniref:hypothetical protein n=1 Tax=Parasphingopyxis algicola TaxID=2026624 RepID=UPI0015A1B55D|nr:hypothetical protein [Parasphingopyxis algicola]QLC26412.1 hypothetical protein HFP57_16155 [Parasphingopyxis algicola]